MYWCLFKNWLLSSGISYPAELIVLSSSKCPWEEIFASWRRVGFLGCRISPLWHLASSQTRANINCCVDLQNQSCLEGSQSYSAFHMDRHKEMKQLPCSGSAEAVEGAGLVEAPPQCPQRIERSITALPKSVLHFEILWGLSLLFIIYFYLHIGCVLFPSCRGAADLQLHFPEEEFNFHTVTLWSALFELCWYMHKCREKQGRQYLNYRNLNYSKCNSSEATGQLCFASHKLTQTLLQPEEGERENAKDKEFR